MKIFKFTHLVPFFINFVVFSFFINVNSQAKQLENGYYIRVNNDSPSHANFQKMVETPNENCSMSKTSLVESYIFLSSGDQGFAIVNIENGVETVFEPSDDVQPVTKLIKYEPTMQSDFYRGLYQIGTKPFVVTESGLFYIAADVNTHLMTCIPIKHWNILGTAIEGGWEPPVLQLLTPSFSDDKRSAVFSNDSLLVTHGFFKFRFANGWKVTLDSITENDCWSKGTKVNANFGGSIDSLILSGENIPSQYSGVYKVQLFWTSGMPIHVTFTKLKDKQQRDYSACKIGILGDAFNNSNGKRSDWEYNWGDDKETNLPKIDDNTYVWTFKDISLFNGGEFKFRQGHDWSGLAIDFQDISTWSGNAKGDFVNMDGKIHVRNSGLVVYSFKLLMDKTTEVISIYVDKK